MKGEHVKNNQTDNNHGEHGEAKRPANPRIYVTDLRAHNQGLHHGRWLDAARPVTNLTADIDGLLQASPVPGAEEWAIHDSDGFQGLHLAEHESLDTVSRLASGIVEHGPAFAHWAQLSGTAEELSQFAERYLGHWPSLTAYAEDVLDDLGLYEQVERCVPDHLRPYVTLDAAGFGRDLVLGGDILTADSEGGIDVFSQR